MHAPMRDRPAYVHYEHRLSALDPLPRFPRGDARQSLEGRRVVTVISQYRIG